jgi:hypothetical protein
VWNTVLNALVFPAPLTAIFMWVNTVAWSRGSTAALPWHTVIIIGALFALVSFPLTVIGAIAGRNMASDFVAPSRTTKVGVISIGVSMSIDTCVRVLYCLCDVCTSVHRVHRIPYSCIYP